MILRQWCPDKVWFLSTKRASPTVHPKYQNFMRIHKFTLFCFHLYFLHIFYSFPTQYQTHLELWRQHSINKIEWAWMQSILFVHSPCCQKSWTRHLNKRESLCFFPFLADKRNSHQLLRTSQTNESCRSTIGRAWNRHTSYSSTQKR